MTEARQGSTGPAVVRAQRIELIDPKGRVRVVLGHVGAADDGYEPGLELFDRQGSCRASLAVRGWGPLLDFGVDGNGVFALGVRDDSEFPDDSPHYDPVTYVDFCDGEGNARLSLEVHRDGRVEMQTPNGPTQQTQLLKVRANRDDDRPRPLT